MPLDENYIARTILRLEHKAKNLLAFQRLTDKWYHIILLRLYLEKELELELKPGGRISIANRDTHYTVETTGSRFTFYYSMKSRAKHTLDLIIEQFVLEEYHNLAVKGRVVLDVGASEGDSAIYFAARGAKRVYALEPYLYSCNLARRNVSANRLNGKIRVLEAGCGGKDAQVLIDPNYRNSMYSTLRHFSTGRRTRIFSLRSLVKKYGLRGAVLKLDCEGSEYEIILNSDNRVLRNFCQILIEYHHGSEELERKLRSAGFRTSYIMQKDYRTLSGKGDGGHVGILLAELGRRASSHSTTV
jgi:FkbM family methyltransferase